MPSNIFAPELSKVSANTFSQGASVDTSGGEFLAGMGELAVEGGRQHAVSSLTSGDLVVPKEALASQEDTDEVGMALAGESINSLGKLAAARKAGLPLPQAKARAAGILKASKNDNAFYSGDVQKAYNQYFGGGGGSSIFTPTPQEKAEADYKASVVALSLKLNVSEDIAEKRIEDNEQMKFDQSKIAYTRAKRDLNGDEYMSYASSSANEARMNISQALIADVNANGALSPQRLLEYKQQLPLIEANLHKKLKKMGGGKKISARAYQDVRKEIDDTIFSLKGLMDDSAMLGIVTANQSILKNNFDGAVLKNFGALKAVKDSMGEVGVTKLLTAFQGNDELGLILENDPFFKQVTGMVGNFEQDLSLIMGKGAKKLFGESMVGAENDQATAGFIGMLGSKGMGKVVEEGAKMNADSVKMFQDAGVKSPGSLSLLSKGEYPALIERNPEGWRKQLEGSLEGVMRSTKAAMIIANGGVAVNFDVQEVEDVWGNSQFSLASRPVVIRAVGDGVDATTQSNLASMVKLVTKYPYLWKGKHSSGLDYIRKLFKIESGVLK